MGVTLWQMLCDQTEAMAREALGDVNSAADWQALRPKRHQQFMHSLGLDPLPPRCDLNVTDRGGFAGQGYTARKIGFQVLPGCWSSANIYYPSPMPKGPAPAVVYVCGHATIGSWHYQYHPIMWARRGYVCLIVETVEQHDNRGEHHGSIKGDFDARVSLGYTPAGLEVWNAMRAVDVLQADPKVDGKRVGITGVSGGGACSFHAAMADDRFKAVSTLCGICSPVDGVLNRHLYGSCDCMHPHNVYGLDIADFAALIAPRGALFCFAEFDPLYQMEEELALVERARKVWRLLGVEDRCQTVVAPCPHGDHADFDRATAALFDEHVAGEKHPDVPRGTTRDLPESTFCVFNGEPPTPDHSDLLPNLLSPRGGVQLPAGAQDWPAIQQGAMQRLLEVAPSLRVRHEPASYRRMGRWHWGVKCDAIPFRGSVGAMDTWLHLIVPRTGRLPACVLNVCNETQNVMHGMTTVGVAVNPEKVAYGSFEPRVAGNNSLPPEQMRMPAGSAMAPVRTSVMRGMALVGTTPVAMTVQDLAGVVDHLMSIEEWQGMSLILMGSGDSAAAVLYYALQDPRVQGVILRDLPASHIESAPVLGVLRALDLPQAVGLMAPRKVAMVERGHNNWTWPTRVYGRLGCPERLIVVDSVNTAVERMLE